MSGCHCDYCSRTSRDFVFDCDWKVENREKELANEVYYFVVTRKEDIDDVRRLREPQRGDPCDKTTWIAALRSQ